MRGECGALGGGEVIDAGNAVFGVQPAFVAHRRCHAQVRVDQKGPPARDFVTNTRAVLRRAFDELRTISVAQAFVVWLLAGEGDGRAADLAIAGAEQAFAAVGVALARALHALATVVGIAGAKTDTPRSAIRVLHTTRETNARGAAEAGLFELTAVAVLERVAHRRIVAAVDGAVRARQVQRLADVAAASARGSCRRAADNVAREWLGPVRVALGAGDQAADRIGLG